MIDIARKTREIMLENKFVKENGISHLNRHVPWQSDGAEQQDARNPESPKNESWFANHERKHHHHEASQKRCDGTLRQHPQCHQRIEREQVFSLAALPPG